MNTIQKLRIYAMLMRLQEIEREKRVILMESFLPEPMKIYLIIEPLPIQYTQLYDKKGKLFDLPKSKYHK